MGKLIFLCGLLLGIVACTTSQPETKVPDSQREVITVLKDLEDQKKVEIHLMDLLTFPSYQSLEALPPEHEIFLEKSQESFNEEGLGEDAANFSFHH